jgi:hypothetical protein
MLMVFLRISFYIESRGGAEIHRSFVELLTAASRPLLVPALVVTEVAYLLGDRIGPHAEIAFARSLERGELLVEPVLDSDWSRIAELTDHDAWLADQQRLRNEDRENAVDPWA